MATAVIGGLVVSTALSLLVVPAFYVLAARAAGALRRFFPKRVSAESGPLARPTSSA
jgi:hypothetical protein